MNDHIPTVVTLPFADGVRDVADYQATLFKQKKIPTHTLTYKKAVERLDLELAESHVRNAFNQIQGNHLRTYGR